MLRVANCSGFYGDRFSAASEMVEGGPIDVLTGDYLAELTMAILWRNRVRDPKSGYATTFLRQMEEVLPTCMERSIRVVSNAGGLAPAILAGRLSELAERLGLGARVAHVEGDDLITRVGELRPLTNLDTGEDLPPDVEPLTANAYLGCWGIAAALGAGADLVVTGRVTDAALVMGPAAWRFGWGPDDLDALAGGPGGRARHRVRHPMHRGQLQLLHRDPRAGASRLPHRRGGARRELCRHQAPRHRGCGHRGDGHRPVALRDRRASLPQPRRDGALRHDSAHRRRARPCSGRGVCAASHPHRPSRWRSTTWAATGTR